MSRKRMIISMVIACSIITCMLISCGRAPVEKAKTAESTKNTEVKPLQFEEVAGQMCEHNKPIMECAECRYEAGIVKVDNSLLKSASTGKCFIGTGSVRTENPLVQIEAMGEIQADPGKFITIRSKISGVISSVKTDIGHNVKPGDILLEMDSNEFRELHLEFFKLSGFLKLAEKNFEREEKLFQKKLTTEKEFLEAQSEVEKNRIELDTIRKKFQLLGLNSAEIKELPKHTELTEPCLLPVRTPIAGTVIERKGAPGALVEANEELITIAELSSLWVWINVYEKDLRLLQATYRNSEIKAEITVASYPERVFHGKVDYIADKMDEHTRTVKARVVLTNPERLLNGSSPFKILITPS